MSIRVSAASGLLFVAIVFAACFGHDVVKITYKNDTSEHIILFVDGERFVQLDPGESVTGDQFPRYLPDHIEAFDDGGNRIFSVTVDMDALKAMDYRIVIRRAEQ